MFPISRHPEHLGTFLKTNLTLSQRIDGDFVYLPIIHFLTLKFKLLQNQFQMIRNVVYVWYVMYMGR